MSPKSVYARRKKPGKFHLVLSGGGRCVGARVSCRCYSPSRVARRCGLRAGPAGCLTATPHFPAGLSAVPAGCATGRVRAPGQRVSGRGVRVPGLHRRERRLGVASRRPAGVQQEADVLAQVGEFLGQLGGFRNGIVVQPHVRASMRLTVPEGKLTGAAGIPEGLPSCAGRGPVRNAARCVGRSRVRYGCRSRALGWSLWAA